MVCVKRIVLDVLKPHHPSSLEFARAIAGIKPDYHVCLTVNEVDENTETIKVELSGNDIDFEDVQAAIKNMGGSLHSIDEVEVQGTPQAD